MSSFEYIIEAHGMVLVNRKLYAPNGSYPQKGNDEFKVGSTPDVVARLDPNQPEIISALGTPVFDRLTLKDPESGLSIDIDTVLFEVTQKRNVVATPVQGLDNSFKELISNGDYEILIKGVLVDINPQRFPFDDMNTLIRLCSTGGELDCTSDFLSIFNIYHLVPTYPKFQQRLGAQNFQPFEITCLSDNPIELKLDEQG